MHELNGKTVQLSLEFVIRVLVVLAGPSDRLKLSKIAVVFTQVKTLLSLLTTLLDAALEDVDMDAVEDNLVQPLAGCTQPVLLLAGTTLK